MPALRPTHIWSHDFVSVRSEHGAPIRVLNVVDEFTRVALGSRVARSIGAADVVKHLEQLFAIHGRPELIRSDNGREFIAATVRDWPTGQGVEAVFIAKASPQQNCYVERFNGSMRDELLHGDVPIGDRSPGGDRELAGRIQPPATAPRARNEDARGVRHLQ